MNTAAWRRFLLTLCVLALTQTGAQVWLDQSLGGIGGVTQAATGSAFVHRVTVSPSSPAYLAGLRTGDVVDLRELSAADRYRWTTGVWWVGERVQLPVVRGNRIRRVWLTVQSYTFRWDWYLGSAGTLWMLLFAALIAWRRADSAEARTLALLLILVNLGSDFEPGNWITPWPGVDAAVAALSPIFNYAGAALLATYAMLFARPPTMLRRVLASLSYLSAGIAALYGIAYVAGIWALTGDPTAAWYSGVFTQFVKWVLPSLFPLLCVLVTLAQTRGAERARIGWASASLGPLYAYFVVLGTLLAVDPGFGSRALTYFGNVVLFIAPLGLTYSLLNRRLLDIGFAINRAAVFTGVSVIIVSIFVLVEWALSKWFSGASHTTNLAISAALALALGLSVRAIHSRVDRVLDTVFFRKRHEDEEAIRMLAREAAYITDPEVLLSRTIAVLEEHADATGAQILLDDEAGNYGSVGENDPAIVRLRATRNVLDLHDVRTVIHGEFAYPMLARGRLLGVLVLGLKRSGESYAPDESDAIAQLAHDAGSALDVLSMKKDNVIDSMRSEVHAMYEAIKALPATIAQANRESERV